MNPTLFMRKILRTRLRRWIAGILALIMMVWAACWYLVPLAVSLPSDLADAPAAGTEIVDRDGRPLRKVLNADGMRAGERIVLDEVPQHFINATLAAEDERFWSHGGIDLIAIVRAIRDGFNAGHAVSGASTISQQLIKISSPSRKRQLSAKLAEFLAARKLEMFWSKNEILTAYFERLDYGNLRIGATEAAQGYFAKPLADCSLAECALLAGLPQAPSRLNPYRNVSRSKKRQEWILGRMLTEGMIDQAQATAAGKESLRLVKNFGAFDAPHFVDQVMASESIAVAKICTTLDLKLQRFCEDSVARQLHRLRTHNVSNAAVVVIENSTGDVQAMVGSADYGARTGGQNNGAMALRSPGSTLKPFTYLIALERGDTAATIVDDIPVDFMTSTGIYAPQNYDHRHHGPVSYRRALGNSLNISAVRVLDRIGGARVLMSALAACEVTTLTEPAEHYGLGLTIGNAEVRLLELTNAYACLARLGDYLPWRLRLDSQVAQPTRVFDADACYILADMLSDPTARAAAFGSDSLLNLSFPVACKTGTSTDYRDNWTIGYSPEFTVGVWAGNFNGEPMMDVSGISGAGPIFRDIMEHLNEVAPFTWYASPPTIAECAVDPATGLPPGAGIAIPRQLVREKFRDWNLPQPDAMLYDPSGRVLLPARYAQWLRGSENWLGETAALAPQKAIASGGQEFQIVSPLPGTVVYLDPDLPNRGAHFPLLTTGSVETLQWASPTLAVDRTSFGQHHAILAEGKHSLVAVDPDTGTSRETWVEVREL
ncbi:MAG: penicillin-binding protein 1C [Verrucomicrobiales bacterium]|jgi:penicillin-binding protein 1C